jgi:hypothetical protein
MQIDAPTLCTTTVDILSAFAEPVEGNKAVNVDVMGDTASLAVNPRYFTDSQECISILQCASRKLANYSFN